MRLDGLRPRLRGPAGADAQSRFTVAPVAPQYTCFTRFLTGTGSVVILPTGHTRRRGMRSEQPHATKNRSELHPAAATYAGLTCRKSVHGD